MSGSPRDLQMWITHGTVDEAEEEDEGDDVRITRITSDKVSRTGFDNWLLCGCGAYDDVAGGESALLGLLERPLDHPSTHTRIEEGTNNEVAVEAFQSVDINKDGWFGAAEIEDVSRALKYTEHKTSKYFSQLIDGADSISQADFVSRACVMMDPQESGFVPSKKARRMLIEIIKIREAFLACDRTRNGRIDAAELLSVLKDLGEDRVTRDQVYERLDSLRGKGRRSAPECLVSPEEGMEMADWEESRDKSLMGTIDYRDFIMAIADGKLLEKGSLFSRLTISNLAALPEYLKAQRYPEPSRELEKTAKAMGEGERSAGLRFAQYTLGQGNGWLGCFSKYMVGTRRTVNVRGGDMYHLGKAQKRAFHWEQYKGIMAGGLSGVVFATAALFIEKYYEKQPALAAEDDGEGSGMMDELSLEGNVLNIFTATVLTVFEIFAIYAYSYHAAAMMTLCAGLKLTPITAERNFLAASIMRAAYEMGHPQDYRYGVDPRRNEWYIAKAVGGMLFMLKRGATKFIVKIFFKKVLFRTALKNLPLDGIDIPINAMWNMFTVQQQMRDIAVITLGPSCIQSIMSSLLEPFRLRECFDESDEEKKRMTICQLLRAVGVVVTQTGVFHPNQYLLMAYLKDELVTDYMMKTFETLTDESSMAVADSGSNNARSKSAPPIGGEDTSNPLRQGSFGAGSGEAETKQKRLSMARLKSMKNELVAGNWQGVMRDDEEQRRVEEESKKYHESFKSAGLDSEEDFLDELPHQSPEDQALTLQVMIFASLIDGRYTPNGFKERAIKAAFRKTLPELVPNLQQMRVVARHFRSGRGFYVEDLTGCTDTVGTVPKLSFGQRACWLCLACWSTFTSLCCTTALSCPQSGAASRWEAPGDVWDQGRGRAGSEEL